MGEKQEKSKVFKEASGGIIATRKTDRSSGEEKTGVTSTTGLGQMLLFLKNVQNKTIHETLKDNSHLGRGYQKIIQCFLTLSNIVLFDFEQ